MVHGFRRQSTAFLQLDQTAFAGYVLAAVSASSALLVIGLLSSPLGRAQYLLMLLVVMVSSLFGGFGPGLLATLISRTVVTYIAHTEPIFDSSFNSWIQQDRLHQPPAFEIAAVLTSLLGSAMRMAWIHRRRSWRDGDNAEQEEALDASCAEPDLEAVEERFHLLVDSATDFAIFMIDPQGKIVNWNPGAERIMGYSESEAVGRHFSMFYPAEDVAKRAPERQLASVIRGGRFEEEGIRVRKDGTCYWAHVVMMALRDGSGRLRGFSKIIRDRSAQKRSEEERTRLVSRMKEALQARDEFLSIASHEFKTPLTTLQLQVQSLQRAASRAGSSGTTPERLVLKLAMIERQVNRMTELINNLLDVSRMMSGRMGMRIEEVDLSAIVRDIAARLREPLRDAGSELTLDAQVPVSGRWSRLRMEGVVMNLLLNAIKYGAGKPIKVRVSSAGGAATLEVSDGGIGIAKDDQTRIFERFERAVSEQYSGMGVGLWMVRQTVEAFGGRVYVKSEVGLGSTFTVELPCDFVAVRATMPSPRPDAGRAA